MQDPVSVKNYGYEKAVSGRLKFVSNPMDLGKIERGDLVYFTMKGDLAVSVTGAFERGVQGFLAECGRTNHGVIAAKEIGIPFYSISSHVFLQENKHYVLSDNTIKEGNEIVSKSQEKPVKIHIPTRTKVFINLGFPKYCLRNNPSLGMAADGVGFARIEFVLFEIIGGKHPVRYMAEHGVQELEQKIYEHFKEAVKAFSGKPFWIRTDDCSPNQLRELSEGELYEGRGTEELVGFRGIARSIDNMWMNLGNFEHSLEGVSWIGVQFRAIAKLAADFPETKLGVFAPMVHSVSEYEQWLDLAKKEIHSPIDYGLMVEVPSVAGEGIAPFLEHHLIKFMILGSNDLTALTLGIDRSDARLEYLFNEEHPMVLHFMVETIQRCKHAGVLTAIGGEAASKPSLMRKLYEAGIDIFSVGPHEEIVSQAREILQTLEHKTS